MSALDCSQYYVSETSEILGVLFQETIIVCVYRQPGASDLTLIYLLTQLCLDHCQDAVVIVGDFNVHK